MNRKQIHPHTRPVEKYKTDESSTKKLNTKIKLKAYIKQSSPNLFLNFKNPNTTTESNER